MHRGEKKKLCFRLIRSICQKGKGNPSVMWGCGAQEGTTCPLVIISGSLKALLLLERYVKGRAPLSGLPENGINISYGNTTHCLCRFSPDTAQWDHNPLQGLLIQTVLHWPDLHCSTPGDTCLKCGTGIMLLSHCCRKEIWSPMEFSVVVSLLVDRSQTFSPAHRGHHWGICS